MGTFDIRMDAPGILRVESLNTNISFDRTGPTTGRVSWNIPTPAAGCEATNQAYNGILVTLDNTPTSGSKIPTNGTVYNSDATADINLFAGDKCGTSFVVGAFYNDLTTTFFDVTGLTPNTPYYISGFPVDKQNRYFREGIHTYSLDFANDGTNGTNGTQIVVLNATQNTTGISPEDFTGLMEGINYDFTLQVGVVPSPRTPIDPVYVQPHPNVYNIPVSGTNSLKYKDLVVEINKQLSLINNVQQSPTAPQTGTFYWDDVSNKLYQWAGSTNVEIPVIVQSDSPNVPANVGSNGTYWYDTASAVLSIWNYPVWEVVDIITSNSNPISPTADTSYWFDGTFGYNWNGYAWCKAQTYVQASNPSIDAQYLIGSFWFNTINSNLFKWDNAFGLWINVDAIQYQEDPFALTDGAYWFDESTNTLSSWNVPLVGWNQQFNVSIVESTPSTPAPGKFWYNPATQILKQWNGLLSVWTLLDVISFPSDPTHHDFCRIWWNTSNNTINTWDEINSSWVTITNFYDQSTDPSLPLVMSNGYIWFNSVTNELSVWNNNCFNLVEYVNYPSDPITSLPNNTVWLNPTTNTFSSYTSPTTWTTIEPIESGEDPTLFPINTYWFNDVTNSLQGWNGLSWVYMLFTNTNPTPATGTLWFNTTNSVLQVWNGVIWAVSTPIATVELDANGNLLFTDTSVGSLSYISIKDVTLFKSIQTPYRYNVPQPGTDGVSDQPSYQELGIGTDGSMDERLDMMNEIRYELGYPVMDVELTPEQLDYAITKSLGEFRTKSSLAYKRGFFFLRVNPETQRYTLTNKVGGFNKIVDIMGIQRLTSSFLSSAHGAGVYGQIVMQHLYNMGTFDLLSYHIMAEYTKTMEVLFAARLTFTWHEQSRELWIHHRFPQTEPMVSVEATVERSEQDLLTDRYTRPWLRRYATATSRLMLAEIRGKFGSLPGASGSITLNSNDLRMAAKEEIELCLREIDDYIADRPEEYGIATTFTFG